MEFPGAKRISKLLHRHPKKAVVLFPDGTCRKTHKRVYPKQWKPLIDQDKFELRCAMVEGCTMYFAGSKGYSEEQIAEAKATLGEAFVSVFVGKQSDWEALEINPIATQLARDSGIIGEVRGVAVFDVE